MAELTSATAPFLGNKPKDECGELRSGLEINEIGVFVAEPGATPTSQSTRPQKMLGALICSLRYYMRT